MKALLVGNGHSAVNPFFLGKFDDYSVFRMNSFFLMKKDPFPKTISLLSIPKEPFLIFFLDYLQKRNIYIFKKVFVRSGGKYFFIPVVNKLQIKSWEQLEHDTGLVTSLDGFIGQNKTAGEKKEKITTAPYLLNLILLRGYKKVVIVGLDFYSNGMKDRRPYMASKVYSLLSPFEAQFRSKKSATGYDQGHGFSIDYDYVCRLIRKYNDVDFTVFVDSGKSMSMWESELSDVKNLKLVVAPLQEYNESLKYCERCEYINKLVKNAAASYLRVYFGNHIKSMLIHLFSSRRQILLRPYFYITDIARRRGND